MMKDAAPRAIQLSEYEPPAYLVDTVDLHFDLREQGTRVVSRLGIRRNPAGRGGALRLDGEGLTPVWVRLNGGELAANRYTINDESLTIAETPDAFVLESEVIITPENNTALEGLYRSSGMFCTQCEPEGFRKITWFPDRPDVMACFTVRVEADKAQYPVLLSNGNPREAGQLPSGRHYAVWDDPIPKPSYLFALVAGDLRFVEDRHTTPSGREVVLRIYVEPENLDKCEHAMRSLVNAMRWDETQYGREYDLDVYNIVAVNDFNMGAMENKGLNIFNSKYVLAQAGHRDRPGFSRYRGCYCARVFPQLDRQSHHLPRLVPAVPEGRFHGLPRPGIFRRHGVSRGQAYRRCAPAARSPVRRRRRPYGPSDSSGVLHRDQ